MNGKLVLSALFVGIAALLAVFFGGLSAPRTAAYAYLAAFAYWVSIALGVLLFVMIIHASEASWAIVLRRVAELMASVFPLLAIAVAPVLLWQDELYLWTKPLAFFSEHEAELLQHKRFWLNTQGFVARSVVYVVVWVFFAELLLWLSVRQQTGRGHVIRAWGAVGIPFVGLTLTFAAFDWFMSLEPFWYSTIYGVYIFAGGFVAALAALVVVSWRLQHPATPRRTPGPLAQALRPDHFYALGRLLFAFVIFWAYIAFSQLLIVWMADLPAEVVWYQTRLANGWGVVGLVLLIGHFALPFLVLLSWPLKRRPAVLAIPAMWMLLIHYVDIFWLIKPVLHPEGFRIHWMDPVAAVGLGALVLAWVGWRARGYPIVPEGDPMLAASLRYSSQ